MMSVLGIYFGPRIISIVETKARKVLNNIRISRELISPAGLEEKIPEEIKIVAIFKDEFRRNKVEAKEATLTLSGKDLIIRTFEMPALPREELQSAVNYEAKRYIPFKIEDLVSDFQSEFDKSSRKNLVLFVGIKKEILDKYLSILNQLNIKINLLEYSAFSVLRMLALTGLSKKGIAGIISADLQEGDEVNFTVLENGFPLFSRDITLMGKPEELTGIEKIEPLVALEKLKKEIRLSLDYYHRRFLTKNIEKVFLISNQDYCSDLESYMKEIGIPAQAIEVMRFIDTSIPFSLSFIKGYASSLSNTIKTKLKIDLSAVKEKMKPLREITLGPETISALIAGLKVDFRILIMSVLVCIATFLFGFYRTLPLRKDLSNVKNMRTKVSLVSPDASYQVLTDVASECQSKMDVLDKLVKKQLYLTELLDALPRTIPAGVWLSGLSFKKEEDKAELRLEGLAYLGDKDRELKIVNDFLLSLRKEPAFLKYFKEIDILSIGSQEIEKETATNFAISASSFKER